MTHLSFKPYTAVPMVPGPTTLHPGILPALFHDYGSGDLEPDFLPYYYEVSATLAKLMGTRHDVVIMSGEGMLGLWAGLKSALRPGDKVLCIGTGLFGNGMADMAAAVGCVTELLSFPENSTIGSGNSLEAIEDAIRRFRPRMITAVHCETPSGTLNPLAELGEMKNRLGVPLLYVDAVSSIGGAPVLMDEWHIDLLLGGSQKCFSCPPSMTTVGVSPAAWDIIESVAYQGYDALLPFKTMRGEGIPPYTPNWHGIAALKASADAILSESCDGKNGAEACFARHQTVAAHCRAGLNALGITLFPAPDAVPSPTVTAAMVPGYIPWSEWDKRLRERGLAVGGSYGPLANKVFRLGHMGAQADMALMEEALAVIEEVV